MGGGEGGGMKRMGVKSKRNEEEGRESLEVREKMEWRCRAVTM